MAARRARASRARPRRDGRSGGLDAALAAAERALGAPFCTDARLHELAGWLDVVTAESTPTPDQAAKLAARKTATCTR
nr:hypothetical protein [Kofleriaceae bacterium]